MSASDRRGGVIDPGPAATEKDPLLEPGDDADLAYLQEVATFFLALRGTGLFLSPLDAELITEWQRQGIPLATVLRGIHQGAQKLYAKREPLRSLRRLKRYVGREAAAGAKGRFRTPSASILPVDPVPASLYDRLLEVVEEHLRALEQMRTEAEAVGDSALLAVLDRTLEALKSLETPDRWGPGGPVSVLLEHGRRFYVDLEAVLPIEDREALRIEAEASLRGFGAMSEEARAETLRELMVSLLRERCRLFEPGRLLALWDE